MKRYRALLSSLTVLLLGAPSTVLVNEVAEFSFPKATLVQSIDMSLFFPPAPDPAGITYISSSDRLLISDSEVEEMDIYSGINVFEMSLSGNLLSTLSTDSFSIEPTGVAYNPIDRHLFFSDDEDRMIFEVNPGPDGLFDSSDDIMTAIDTMTFGSFDPEDIAFDSLRGVLYLVDGNNAEVYVISPGANGTFDGPPPAGDDQFTHFDTNGFGVIDPEGIAVNPDTGNLIVVGRPREKIIELTTTGTIVRTIDISAAHPVKPAGVTFAPGSLDPAVMNIYIVDRGVDNDADPDENDGRVYEMSLPPITPGNRPPTVDAGVDKQITAPNVAVLEGAVSDHGVPYPPGVLATAWSLVSGPGRVAFADGNAVDTTVRFSSPGTYVLRLTAFDGELEAVDYVTFVITGLKGERVIEVRVAASSDDAEEKAQRTVLKSRDLELVLDNITQVVGMRFNGVDIPRGARILNAYIQFHVDETDSEPTLLRIQGEDVDDASIFSESKWDISSRSRTSAYVSWFPAPWMPGDGAGPNQRTPPIVTIIQEIVNRLGWSSGNSLVVIITGSGRRTAEAYERSPLGAPMLHVEYVPELPARGCVEQSASVEVYQEFRCRCASLHSIFSKIAGKISIRVPCRF